MRVSWNRFGTKTSMEIGIWPRLGKLTAVRYGRSRGRIQNLARFSLRVRLIAPPLFGRRLVRRESSRLIRCSRPSKICHLLATSLVLVDKVGEGSGPEARGSKHWIKRTNLVDSRTSVTDVKFAPKTLGLLLATCSADGFIRIYEAPDIMNLSQWTLQHDINCKLSCSCLTWNPSFSR